MRSTQDNKLDFQYYLFKKKKVPLVTLHFFPCHQWESAHNTICISTKLIIQNIFQSAAVRVSTFVCLVYVLFSFCGSCLPIV